MKYYSLDEENTKAKLGGLLVDNDNVNMDDDGDNDNNEDNVKLKNIEEDDPVNKVSEDKNMTIVIHMRAASIINKSYAC